VSRRSRQWLDRPVEWSRDDLEYMSSLSWVQDDHARQTLAAERRTRRRLRREFLVKLAWVVAVLTTSTLTALSLTGVI